MYDGMANSVLIFLNFLSVFNLKKKLEPFSNLNFFLLNLAPEDDDGAVGDAAVAGLPLGEVVHRQPSVGV